MAEGEEHHRHRLEERMVDSEVRTRGRGQWMAFALALVVIVGGIILIATDKEAWGLSAILLTLATLAGVFIYSQERTGGRNDSEPTNGDNPELPPARDRSSRRRRPGSRRGG